MNLVNARAGARIALIAFSVASLLLSRGVAAPFAYGQQENAQWPHSVVSLLSDHQSLRPGSRIWLGLRFQMEKGWHIYWVNPGDSGEPPKVQWQLPEGFRVGPMEWPAPERVTAPSIVDYGYADEALLIAPLTVPKGLRTGQKPTIAAKIDWLVCKDICIPAKGQLSLTLPVSTVTGWKASAGSADVVMLQEARAKVPKRPPATWKIYVIAKKDDFVLTVVTGREERAVTFFPLKPEQIKNDATQAATPFAKGVRLKLQKSDGLLKPISELRGVIELGTGQAYEIAAPVHADSARKM